MIIQVEKMVEKEKDVAVKEDFQTESQLLGN